MAQSRDDVLTVFKVLGEAETAGAYRRVSGAAGLFASRTDAMGRSQLQAGVAFGASAAAIAFFGRSATMAANDQVALNRAAAGLHAPVSELHAWAVGVENATGQDPQRVASLAGVFGRFQFPTDQAERFTVAVLNAEQALAPLGVRAEMISRAVARAVESGRAGRLASFGVIVDDKQFKEATTQAARMEIILRALEQVGGDAAVQFRDSLPGALQAFQSQAKEAERGIGESLIGPLRGIAEVGVGALRIFNALPGPIKTTATTVGVMLAGAVALYSGGTLLALNNTVRLAEAHFRAAAGARAQAAAETGLAGSVAAVAGTSGAAAGAIPASMVGAIAGARGGAGAAAAGAAVVPEAEAAVGGLGMLARGKAFLSTTAGKTAGIAGIAGLGLSLLPSSGDRGLDEGKDVLAGALQGGALGATVGSFFPGAGTAIGGTIGAVAGAGMAGLTDWQQDQERTQAERQAGNGGTGLDKTNELLEEQTRLLEAIHRDRALPSNDFSGRDQAAGLFD